MKLRCPHCGHSASLQDFANEEAARKAVLLAADLPKSIGYLTLRYVGLFRPSSRSLSWERTLKLMQQLKVDIDRAQIERHGRIWHAPEALWQHAFVAMNEKAEAGTLKLPLKNHGYLYEIISSAQNSAEAREEQKVEEKRQQNQHRQKPVQAKKAEQTEQTEQNKELGDSTMNQVFKQLGAKRKHGGSNE